LKFYILKKKFYDIFCDTFFVLLVKSDDLSNILNKKCIQFIKAELNIILKLANQACTLSLNLIFIIFSFVWYIIYRIKKYVRNRMMPTAPSPSKFVLCRVYFLTTSNGWYVKYPPRRKEKGNGGVPMGFGRTVVFNDHKYHQFYRDSCKTLLIYFDNHASFKMKEDDIEPNWVQRPSDPRLPQGEGKTAQKASDFG
jgi:hypothetical protein